MVRFYYNIKLSACTNKIALNKMAVSLANETIFPFRKSKFTQIINIKEKG